MTSSMRARERTLDPRKGLEAGRPEPPASEPPPAATLTPQPPPEPEPAALGLESLWTPVDSPPPALEPDAPAAEAIRAALAPELATWLAQQDGLRADLDIEYLHKARVALRRTRGVIRQLRAALPRSASKDLVHEIRWLARVCGAQRDLDVLLEQFDGLVQELPKAARKDLDVLRSAAAKKRERARAALLKTLDGQRYRSLLLAWSAFLVPDTPPHDARGRVPILAFVTRRLARRHARLIERGKRLSARSSGAAFHALRIECKKLRYLLDAFRSLFPIERMDPVLEGLKELQALLGATNDARVQGERLRRFAMDLDVPHGARAASLIAAGRALAALEAREKRSRADFLLRFRAYARERAPMEALLAESEGL